jgi:uncharacterized protein YbaP (TraB family)
MRLVRGLRALLLAALLALLAFPAAADPPMWRVHGRGGEIVLFGSVHLLSPGLDWTSPALLAALARADEVWFEIPLDADARAAAARLAASQSRLPAGRTLSSLLSPEGRARLARASAAVGLPPKALEGYRPWFAEITLTLLELQAHGAQEGAGVEETLSRAAPATAARKALETPEQQVAILAGASEPDQVASLEESLRQMEDDPDAFDALQKAWIAGDVGWLQREAVEPLRKAAPAVYERLVAARNRQWAARIERLLARRERAFIVVGVGHLVGPEGVPALLRRRGIAVEGP